MRECSFFYHKHVSEISWSCDSLIEICECTCYGDVAVLYNASIIEVRQNVDIDV